MNFKELAALAAEKSKGIKSFLNSFLDEKSLVEVDAFIATETPLGRAEGEGVVAGLASVDGEQVAVFATNPEVMKGSIGKGAADKIARLIKNAVKTGSPLIGVLDTAGARFAEGITALEGYAEILSAFSGAYASVPTILIIKGSNFGSLSYLAAFADVVIATDKAVTATASPLIIASKTNLDAEKIGGIAMHGESGVYSLNVKGEKELKTAVSSLVSLFCAPVKECADDPNRVCKSLKAGAKPASVIAEVCDKGSFIELKGACAPEIITGLARLNGISVGIYANNPEADGGRLSEKAAFKLSELVNTCESFGLPVVGFVDCAGATVNLESEKGALIREIGGLIYALNNTCCKKISVIIGNAVGIGYSALASKSVTDYTAAWENAKIGCLESEAAAKLVYSVEIAKAKDKAKAEKAMAEAYAEENMSAGIAAAGGFIDNVISPALTRQYVIAAVAAFLEK